MKMFYHQLVFTVNNTENSTDFFFFFFTDLTLFVGTPAACFTSGMLGHFYTLWPRCKGEFRAEAPDCGSSRGWDGWVSPIADPLLSTHQPQSHVSRPAPAVEVLLIFHNSLQGPRHKAGCLEAVLWCKMCCIMHRICYVFCFRLSKGLPFESLSDWERGKCQCVLWWPEWFVKMLLTNYTPGQHDTVTTLNFTQGRTF